MQHAADAPQHDSDGRDDGEPVARGAAIAEQPLRNLDARVATKQCTGDGFARSKNQPALLVMPVQPAFRREINQLGPEERACQRRDVDEHEPRVALRHARPERNAHENARKHQPAVGGGVRRKHASIT